MSSFARYSLLRFGLLFAAIVVLYLVGARGWLLIVLAAVVSAALGYILLRRQRDEVTQAFVERRQSALDKRIAADNAAEDEDEDETQPRR